MALERDQVAAQRAGVEDGDGEPVGLDQRRDHQCRLGRPSPIDRGSADGGAGGDALDGEAAVPLLLQDPEGCREDRLVVAGVAGSTRTPRPLPVSRATGSLDVTAGFLLERTPIDYITLRNLFVEFKISM